MDDAHERAVAAVRASGVGYRVVEYGDVRSLDEAARRRGISVDRLLKTMVVRVGDEYCLILVPGDRRIDWAKLRSHLGVRRLALADEDQARAATGYERGAITPFGAGDWPVLVDDAVPFEGEVSLGGGMRGRAIHVAAEDLLGLTSGTRVDLTRPLKGPTG